MPGRIRTLKPEILEDEKTAGLDHESFRLFVALILLADDYGNVRASGAYLNGAIFHSCGPSRGAIEGLNILAKVGLARLYEAGGQAYLHITGWEKHQKVDHPGKPHCPSHKKANPLDHLADDSNPREVLAKPREALAQDPDPLPVPTTPTPTSDPARPREGSSTRLARIAGWHADAMRKGRGYTAIVEDFDGAGFCEPVLASLCDVDCERVIRAFVSDNSDEWLAEQWETRKRRSLRWLTAERVNAYLAPPPPSRMISAAVIAALDVPPNGPEDDLDH
jgi:hypothetical protein